MKTTDRNAQVGTTPRRIVVVPRWGAREQDDWSPWLQAELAGSAAGTLADTVLVGHSIGCQAALHFLAGLPASTRVRGTVCVAGWWAVAEPWESIRPWTQNPPDLRRVRASCGRLRVLLSDNDPFTADAAANGRLWQERLGAAVEVVPAAAHFNRPQEPRVLAELLRWYAA